MKAIYAEIKTETPQTWSYATDEFAGTCIIAKDEMRVKFLFEHQGKNFPDVLKIDEAIDSLLQEPVSVEGLCETLHEIMPWLTITSMGRAISHGWITSKIEPSNDFPFLERQ